METHSSTVSVSRLLSELVTAEAALDRAWAMCAVSGGSRDDEALASFGLRVAEAGMYTVDAGKAFSALAPRLLAAERTQ